MSQLEARMAAALSERFGEPVSVTGSRGIGGGCINEAMALETSKGRFFAKSNASVLEGLFAREAAGLSAMRKSGTRLAVPRVICFEDPAPGAPGFLITELLEPGRRERGFDEALGRGLAELHRATSDRGFGFEVDTYCGSTVQPNGWMDRWVDFYRERRIGFQMKLGRDRGVFSKGDARATESFLARLDDLLAGPAEPPALIHGDLWGGNLHVAPDGRPSLIDPAVYYGHREAELGMMTLFGGFSGRVFDAYHEAWPLEPGWRDRNALYTLYHLMNHANLFGGGYTGQAMSIVRRHA